MSSESKRFRVLSLDGEGIKGAFTAAVLAEWEQRDFLDCFGNCEAILQLLELCRRGLVQIIDLACVGGNDTVNHENCARDRSQCCKPRSCLFQPFE